MYTYSTVLVCFSVCVMENIYLERVLESGES